MKKKLTALFLALALTASTLLPAAAEIFPDGIATPETAGVPSAEESAPGDFETSSESFSLHTESTDPSAVVQAASIFDGGSGTESDPYLISTADQLRAINDYLDCSFKLCADIDMANEGNWVPIGITYTPVSISTAEEFNAFYSENYGYIYYLAETGQYVRSNSTFNQKITTYYYCNSSTFRGFFDGCGHTISHLTMCPSADHSVYGLFSTICNASIKNLTLNDIFYTDGINLGSEFSSRHITCGGIAGQASNSLIQNCIVRGKITYTSDNHRGLTAGGIVADAESTTIQNCINFCNIDSFIVNSVIGGICASPSAGQILNCSNYGAINLNSPESLSRNVNPKIGGIVGFSQADILYSTNFGSITSHVSNSSQTGAVYIAGIAGLSLTRIIQCINYGDIFHSSPQMDAHVGGIFCNYEDDYEEHAPSSNNLVSNCYVLNNSIDISGKSAYLYIIGPDGFSIGYSDCYYKQCFSRAGISYSYSCSSGGKADLISDPSESRVLAASDFLKESTYPGFDFASTWRVSPTAGGPVLQSDPYAPDDSTPTPSPSPNPGDDIDFDVNIYRANQMLDPEKYPYAGYVIDDLARDTPSQIYKDALANNAAFATNIAVWKGTTGAIDLVDSGPAKTAEMMIERKDMYTALIIASFQANTGKSVLEGYAADAKKISDVSKKAIDALSKANKHYITKPLNKLSEDEQADFLHEVGIALGADPDNKWGKVLKNGSRFMKNCSSVLEFADMMCDSIYLVDLAEGQKDLLDALLDADPQDPDLRLAIEECKEIANSSYEEACATTVLRFSGKKAFEDTLDAYWGFYKKIMGMASPEAAALLEIMKSGKTFCDAFLGTSSTIESYYKIYAILNLEALATSAYWKLENQYANDKTAKNAELYLGMVDLMYGIWSVDCDQARGFVDSLDPLFVKLVAGGLSIINEDFVNSTDTGKRNKVKAQIDNLKQIYQRKRELINMVWVEWLEVDYPGSGLYEYYEPIASKPLQDRVKKIKVSCPVNVSVTDAAGTEIAAIRDGCLTASGNVAVTLDGDSKIFTFYDDADYSISVEGYDTGTMDVTASVYGENDTRTITYVDVPVSGSSVHHIRELTQDGSCELTGDQDTPVSKQWDSDTPEAFTTYTVDVTNGVADNGGTPCHTITAVPGQTITVSAQMLDDQELIRWQATGCTLSDTSAETISFVMPAQNVALTPVLTDSSQIPDPDDYTVTSSSYTIDDTYITGVEPCTICSVMLPQLTSKSLLYLTDTDGMILDEDATVCTGSTATNAKTVLTVVVAGDVNGDGTVSSSDLFQMCRAMMRVDKLDGAALKAATPASQQKNQPASSDLYRTCRYLMKLTNSMYHD